MKKTLALLVALLLAGCGDDAPTTALPDPAPHRPIIYTRQRADNTMEIVRSLSDGSAPQIVIPKGTLLTEPVDGHILYLGADEANLYIAGIDGSSPTIVRSANYPAYQNGTISPDRQLLASVDWNSGRAELNVQRIGETESKTIATDIRVQSRPTFSPDGRRLAFFATDNRVYTINIDGTERRAVTAAPSSTQRDDNHVGFSPEWSPSGEWLAVESLSSETIDIIRVDGVTAAPLPSFRGSFPLWSPDGTEISCTDNGWIVIHPIAGSSLGLIDRRNATRFDGAPWSPDRRRLLTQGDATRSTTTLECIDIARKEPLVIAEDVLNAYWLP
jgi:hypothetical protein